MNNNCITTYTGRHIDPLHPDPDMICIEDIAHALSLICRGNGQVKTFFSVGQHCINCAREALARGYSRRVAFACLLPVSYTHLDVYKRQHWSHVPLLR